LHEFASLRDNHHFTPLFRCKVVLTVREQPAALMGENQKRLSTNRPGDQCAVNRHERIVGDQSNQSTSGFAKLGEQTIGPAGKEAPVTRESNNFRLVLVKTLVK